MSIIGDLINFILHIDVHLTTLVNDYGLLIYLILFAIIFIETGIVIFPFLPGDSLLFAAGALSALSGSTLNWFLLIIIMGVAAVLGDSLNYYLGKKLGNNMLKHQWLKKFIDGKRMRQAELFFEKNGGKAIMIGRFIPFIRTFIPFIAGMSKMNYSHFIFYNIVGGFIWVFIGVGSGYLFGNIPVIRDNFSLVVLLIVAISVVPIIISYFKGRKSDLGGKTTK
ncbi:VTT domain-containing protein [Paenibacillus endoradicis]|uniref:VTT domain-containing protein n=1 Tax=Paenibacillus endoradicis TaxID=2972487 RepID=UPI0021592D9C|nr:VTT domain-containing protein [Paenibacillus endoradicis]MCR8655756.1 VTT domain-containing protein [Paenibacillus endoradicis]MCR8658082.1 VTT domain-containing protein [Paenibacillus endoradicis]